MQYERVQGGSRLSGCRKVSNLEFDGFHLHFYAPYRRMEDIQCCNILLSYSQ